MYTSCPLLPPKADRCRVKPWRTLDIDPPTIDWRKAAIASHHSEFLSLLKVSQIDATVIPAGDVDEPLAHSAP